jgi:exodeoxyribonuclease III
LKVATFNVNSLRKRLPVVTHWLQTYNPDVLCLQETKVQDSEFPVQTFADLGYQVAFRGMKAYNGVATITRTLPDRIVHGFGESGEDDESVRLLRVDVNGIAIFNTYVPQGYSIKSDKYQFKLDWYRRLGAYFSTHLQPGQPALWLGDLNVAPEPIDVYHPDRRVNDVDFHIDARQAFKAVRDQGWTDLFRKLHPDRLQYTYWDYFRNAFENNWGWRIDHILAAGPIADRCRAIDVDMEPRRAPAASDHTVVWAEFD